MKKRITLVIGSLLALIVISTGAVVILMSVLPHDDNPSQQTATPDEKASAAAAKTAAEAALASGEATKALSLYKQAREAYSALDAQSSSYSEASPSSETADIDAQINLLESSPTSETPAPAMSSTELPLTGN